MSHVPLTTNRLSQTPPTKVNTVRDFNRSTKINSVNNITGSLVIVNNEFERNFICNLNNATFFLINLLKDFEKFLESLKILIKV